VDGIPDKESTSGTITNVNDTTNALNFTVGSESDGANYFDGKVDDVRFYNYALSGTQAKKLSINDAEARFGPTSGTP
jgi:hypothetical protein